MALSQEEQYTGGRVMTKFLLDGDIDSATMYMNMLETNDDRMNVLWATVAVQKGAILSLANQLGIDPVEVMRNIIAKSAAGIEE